jgi:hypothetical protein
VRKIVFSIIGISLVMIAGAKEKIIHGEITYIASGSVYTSLGRLAGLTDSLRIIVYQDADTLGFLQVFGVSSKSSVCKIIEMRKQFHVSDKVVAYVQIPTPVQSSPAAIQDTLDRIVIGTTTKTRVIPLIQSDNSFVKLRGRIGLQYNTIVFDDASMNMQQAGMVASLRGDFSNVPLKFDFYGTIRMSGRNNAAPFSSKGSNDSRIYRSSLEYDDQTTIIDLGRILPMYASSAGYIDGISVARRTNKFTSGFSIGFQPNSSLQMPSTETKKFSVFTQYQANDSMNMTASAAYTRIWSSTGIEREAISAYVSLYTFGGFSLYTSSDFDLRTLLNGDNRLSPSLSLLICSANYQFSEKVTVGISLDASRPVYSFSSTKSIPDSLLDKQLRSGASFNINVSPWHGTGIYNVSTIRFGKNNFGKEYSNSSSAFYNNILETGINTRINYLINKNTFTMMHGYGINLQRTVFGVEIGVRFQENRSEVKQLRIANTTKTVGMDISAFLSNQYTLIGSFDLMHGAGSTTRLVYVELSRRF